MRPHDVEEREGPSQHKWCCCGGGRGCIVRIKVNANVWVSDWMKVYGCGW